MTASTFFTTSYRKHAIHCTVRGDRETCRIQAPDGAVVGHSRSVEGAKRKIRATASGLGGSHAPAKRRPRGRFPHNLPTRANFVAWYRDVLNTGEYPGMTANTIDALVLLAQGEINEKRGSTIALWKADGDAAQEAWENIGGQGKVSIAKLRALPKRS